MTFKAWIFQSWTIQAKMVEGVEKSWIKEFMFESLGLESSWLKISWLKRWGLKSPATFYKAGFHDVDGVDYSEQALDLAHKLAKDSDIPDLNFFVSIFLDLFFIKFCIGLVFCFQISHGWWQ